MIKRLEIEKFRSLKNINFDIAKNITVLAGANCVGKSTILAMTGHCFELKKKRKKTVPILQNAFRTEF